MSFVSSKTSPGFPHGKFFDGLKWSQVKNAPDALTAIKSFPLGGSLRLVKELGTPPSPGPAFAGTATSVPASQTGVTCLTLTLPGSPSFKAMFNSRQQAEGLYLVKPMGLLELKGPAADKVFTDLVARLNGCKFLTQENVKAIFTNAATTTRQEIDKPQVYANLGRVRAIAPPFAACPSLETA